MAIEFCRSTELSLAELASLFTASYEGYSIPFAVDETQLAYMVDVFDLDLNRSLVAVDGERPVGLANLGLRGEQTWLGGVGVVADRRGSGIGESLIRALLDEARTAGAHEMVLEVIVENTAAIALYEKLGFARTREFEVLSLEAADEPANADEMDADEAMRTVAKMRTAPEPWQRADETIAKLPRRGALAADGAAAVFSQDAERVSVLQAAGTADGLRTLVAALRSRGSVTALNFPADEPVATTLREAGATVRVRQYEMSLAL